ncbi:hypothetical protein BJF93_05220 [Xaviernesmea oryzae]|uniref:N-acetyltransferase domain-containing protein n=1 Tax=Xaviernesmea oryzae TaxID=464029 RepID=A0A1Q9ARI0_9HYPH|nr:GNAT family N-acetyltransferase [Xaviernesmea oryzae]OLP58042.1 hypothetical protein BJF93_05220 [Xaviernesmea oryzae]SEL84603.1 Acetyltransferase (GNAT) family protein [Xaviernesmea oryzae]
MSLAIRPVRFDDRAAITDIHVRQSQRTYAHFLPATYLLEVVPVEKQALWQDRIVETGAAPNVLIRVAESEEGLVAGFACFVLKPEDPWGVYLHNLYVDTPFAGQGLGRKLFRAGLVDLPEDARDRPVHLTAFAENRKACALYDRLGGVIGERWMTERADCPPIETLRYCWPDRQTALAGLAGVLHAQA